MSTTAHWLNSLALVVGWAVIGSALFFGLVSLAAWLQGARRQEGFPRTRRRRFL